MKSVLASIPLYQFSTLQAPKCVLHHLGIYIRKFLWEGGKQDNKKFCLVNWKTIRAQKQHGGFGIRDPAMVNMVMEAKLYWILKKTPDLWWVQVMREKNSHHHNNKEEHMEENQGSPI